MEHWSTDYTKDIMFIILQFAIISFIKLINITFFVESSKIVNYKKYEYKYIA